MYVNISRWTIENIFGFRIGLRIFRVFNEKMIDGDIQEKQDEGISFYLLKIYLKLWYYLSFRILIISLD